MFNTFKKCCGIVAMCALYLYSAPAAFAQCEGVELSITLDYDFWPEESSWSLTSDGVEVASGDAYTGGELAGDNASETVVACVADDACYVFTMSDSFGDGGTNYTITDAEGNVLGSAAGWTGTSTSSDFCLSSSDGGDGTGDGSDECTENEVALSLVFDAYAGETGWSIADADGNIVAEAAEGTYFGATAADETACLSDGCYTLTVTDQFSDGMCCSFGEGSYTLTDADGNVLASGGDFGASESTDFCLGEVAITGCTDANACNFNPLATEDDGSCDLTLQTVSVSVTSNFWASETGFTIYNADTGEAVASLAAGAYTNGADIAESACLSDNACYYIEFTDSFGDGMSGGTWTVTWNGVAVVTGGAGAWSSQSSDTWCFGPGCQDPAASNYSATATSDGGNCEYVGCTDADACNYDAAATTDDGSCNYESLVLDINPDTWAGEISWDLVDTAGAVIAAGLFEGAEFCLPSDCYTFTIYDSFGDGICCGFGQGSYSLTDGNGLVIVTGGEYGASESTSFCLPAFPGCTDELACNYVDGSNLDDGSCDYSCIGCMDQAAANYDPTATQENEGSCIYCDAGTYVAIIEMYDLGGDGWNGANYYMDSFDGSTSISGNWDEADTYIADAGIDFHCIPLGCYIFTSGGGAADNEIAVVITDQFGTVYGDQPESGYYGPLPPPVGFPSGGWFIDFGLLGDCGFEGCTDPYCFNYNISATVDDGSCICPPPNNAIGDAEAIGCDMEVSGSLENASDEEGLAGIFAGTTVTTGGVWYEFNADADYQVFANTCNTPTATSGFADPVTDTKMHVFVYNDAGDLEPIVGNDDACGLMSGVAFLAETGNNYYIYVSRFSVFTGGTEFLLEVTCEVCDEFPSNDFCEDATPQLDGVTFTGSVCCANPATIPAFGGTVYGVWFTFNSTDPVSGLDFDTFLFDLTNVDAGILSLTIYLDGGDCESLGTFVGCLFTGTCAGSIESFITLEPNTDYYFFVGTTDATTCGDFEFTTTGIFLGCTDPSADNYLDIANQDDGSCVYSAVPDNDLCENAFDLPCNSGYLEGSMGGATADGAPNVTCSPCEAGENAAFVTAGGGTWDGEVSWSITDAAGNVYSGAATAGDWVCGMAEGDFLFEGFDSFGDGWNGATANVYFNGNQVVDAFTITTGAYGSVTATAIDDGTQDIPNDPVPGVWWTFAGTGELHTLNTCGSVIDTRVQVYSSVSASCGVYDCALDVTGSVIDNSASFEGCGFFDQDDAYVQFVSDPSLYYFVYVSYENDGVFNGQGTYQIELSCEEAIEGCTISAACNFNPDANIETNDICEYTSCACDDNPGGTTILVNMYDSFGDGWTGSNSGSPGGYEIFDGDGNSVAANYIDEAFYQVDEDNVTGAEYGLDVLCLDPGCYTYAFTGAFIWDGEQSWSVTDGDGNEIIAGGAGGSLVTEIYPFSAGPDIVCGCTDEIACNYNSEATDENGTCEYETCAGCMDPDACDYDPEATIDDNSCCYGTCLTITMEDSFGDGWTGCDIVITDLEGNVVINTTLTLDNSDGSYLQEVYCMDAGCYILTTGDDTFNFEPSWSISGVFGGVISGGELFGPEYISVGGNNCIEGCDVACACNYDPAANILVIEECNFDDCSGCTYADASNYDENASVDNGTCEFDLSNPCPADINEDGSVTTADLLVFLGAFGTVCE